MPTATSSKSPLSVGSRVFARVDMKGVPAGTPGKVIHVQGLSWTRYWVWFDNGPRVGTLHRDKLATLEEWERRNAAPTEATAVAVVAGGEAPVGAAIATGGDVGGVPGHLLERSRNARARWAAKQG